MPGSLESSVARSSIADNADRSERELEGEIEPARDLPHLRLLRRGRLLLRVLDGDEDEILEHLDVVGRDHALVDLDRPDVALAVGLHAHHAAARAPRDDLMVER